MANASKETKKRFHLIGCQIVINGTGLVYDVNKRQATITQDIRENQKLVHNLDHLTFS